MLKKLKLPKLPKLVMITPPVLSAMSVVFFVSSIYFLGQSGFYRTKLSESHTNLIKAKQELDSFKKIDQVVRNDECDDKKTALWIQNLERKL